MKIKILTIGMTDNANIQSLTDIYRNRLKYYISFEMEHIPDLKKTKNLTIMQQKSMEGKMILKKIEPSDAVILLDEKGKSYSSLEFAQFLQKKMNSGLKRLVIVIGGPYGFSEEIYEKFKEKLSVSKMTFSHQMVRILITEQLYRAFTILKNEPYHHE
jgi:23S rRNA (pseudouridine1915-N3)-methyltransferase